MSSPGQYNWGECPNCLGRGKKYPHGPTAAPERCEPCRGIGRVCTQDSGPTFNAAGKRNGTTKGHPLGDCSECWGLVTTFYDEALLKTAKTLEQADLMRSQRRGHREDLVSAGLHFEERLLALGGADKEAEERLLRLEARFDELEAVRPKQLAAPKAKGKKKESP